MQKHRGSIYGKRKTENGKWRTENGKQYSCPSSKRDEQRFALRRELTKAHSKWKFHSLVSGFATATPSPARENFTNVWWVESKTI